MSPQDVELFHTDTMSLGEGTIWLDDHRGVGWVDIEERAVYFKTADLRQSKFWTLPERPTAITPWRGNKVLLATEKSLGSFDLESGEFESLIALSDLGQGVRLNDGATDPAGRFWVGSMDEVNGKPLGKIYCLHANGRLIAMLDGIGISNGICFAPDGNTMYYADSAAGEIYRCDFDIETARLSNRSLFAPKDTCPGIPDGAAIDQDGYLWSCRWDGWGLARFSPEGSLDRFVEVPVARPTRCTFGGPDMKTLYVSSARIDISESDLEMQPNAGSVFQLSLPIAGSRATPYAASATTKFRVRSDA